MGYTIFKFVKYCDFFGINCNLTFGRKLVYKSKFSGFMSLIVFLSIVAILVLQSFTIIS